MSFRDSTLLDAINSGDANAVTVILSNGADVNARNASGQTPVILAILTGHDHILRLLLSAGADPTLQDNTGLSAIDWADRKGRPDLRQLLSGKFDEASVSKSNEIQSDSASTTPSDIPTDRPLTSDEKTLRFLAGLKQRFAEKADREQVKLRPPDNGPAPTDVIARAGTKVAEPESVFKEPTPPVSAPEIELNKVPATPEKKLPVRKRCPQCNTIYNDELLAYCAHHIVPLVDADEPIAPVVTTTPNSSSLLLWTIVAITLAIAAFAGLFLINSLLRNTSAPSKSEVATPQPTREPGGIPVVGSELAGRVSSLPVAKAPVEPDQPAVVITVHVRVDKSGQVVSATASSDNKVLREAAIEAAKKSTFTSKKSGRPIEGTITYTFNP